MNFSEFIQERITELHGGLLNQERYNNFVADTAVKLLVAHYPKIDHAQAIETAKQLAWGLKLRVYLNGKKNETV